MLSAGCAKTTDAVTNQPSETEPAPASARAPAAEAEAKAPPAVTTGACDEHQTAVSAEADARAEPWSIVQHLEKNFPDGKVSWLMTEGPYQTYVIDTGAEHFGRCDDTGCYLFAAPTALIQEAVEASLSGEGHDPAVLGRELGLPAKNFEGPLRMMTLDLRATDTCVRLPVDADPGVWKCKSAEDVDCFKFGGYTSGGVPEVMVIGAPVGPTQVESIP